MLVMFVLRRNDRRRARRRPLPSLAKRPALGNLTNHPPSRPASVAGSEYLGAPSSSRSSYAGSLGNNSSSAGLLENGPVSARPPAPAPPTSILHCRMLAPPSARPPVRPPTRSLARPTARPHFIVVFCLAISALLRLLPRAARPPAGAPPPLPSSPPLLLPSCSPPLLPSSPPPLRRSPPPPRTAPVSTFRRYGQEMYA